LVAVSVETWELDVFGHHQKLLYALQCLATTE